jgi:D-alanine--poly(phosphoribitol) ligase subunit 1
VNQVATLIDAIDAAAAVHGTRLAIWARGETLGYAELVATSSQIASAMLEHGVMPGERIAILAQRSVAAYLAVVAATRAGCVYVPLNLRFPLARNRAMLELSGATVLVIDAECRERFGELLATPPSSLRIVVSIDDEVVLPRGSRLVPIGQREIAATRPRASWPVRAPDDDCYLIFTSGSTGEPKGVPISHGNLLAYRAGHDEIVPATHDDRIIQLGDLSFDISVIGIVMALTHGAALYDVPEHANLLATRFVSEHELTIWMSMPSAIALAREAGVLEEGSMPSLRCSQIGGEALHGAVAAAWAAAAPSSAIYNLYGPTEGTIAWSSYRYGSRPDDATSLVPIGRPLRGQRMEAFGDDDRPVPDGEVGELWLAGSQLTRGYWNAPDLDMIKFRTIAGVRWYRTGDLVRRSEPVGFHYVGRVDQQVKILGFRVELLEIETALCELVARDAVAVIAWPIASDGAALGTIAFVPGPAVDATAVLAALRTRLPPYAIPSRIVAVEQLPLTAVGKTDYLALRRHPALQAAAEP